MPVPIPLGNWRHHTRNAHIQVSAQLQTESGQWTLQTVYVRPDESGLFCGKFDNMNGCFVEGSSDSWLKSAKNVVYTVRTEVLQPDLEWKPDIMDYKCNDMIDVENGKFHCNTQWQVLEYEYPSDVNAIEDGPP